MKRLDVRGLACPEPIVLAKRAMVDDGEPQLALLTDSEVTRDNLEKFAASKGFAFAVRELPGGWEITLAAGDGAADVTPQPAVAEARAPVVLCTTAHFGGPSGELGTILIRAFFKTLLDLDTKPSTILFVNEGVNLACFDEPVIDYCRQLEGQGVEVISCGTCLDYFDLLGKQQVGRVGNMYDIAGALLEAGHVVEP